MAYDGTLQFDTKIDKTGFKNDLSALEKSASMAGQVMQGVFSANLLEKGIEKMVEFGKKSIDLASDLEEVQNVVDVTFGDGADKIEAFAQSASASFGLTELQSKQFSGTIGAMVKSMGLTDDAALEMSTSLVGLTGDLASFYNLDHQAAFDKIRSGISGETEPLKQLGINMSVANLEAYALSKGIKTAYDKMSEAEKVQLRYGYIMQQTTDAQGDFVRTQDSYANQVRVLQNNLDTLAANVGSALIPALTSAVSWVNSFFDGPGPENKTQAAINDAITSLGTLDADLQNIKNNYAKEAITIQLNYEEAGELLETLESLKAAADKGFGDRTLKLGMTGEDVAALQDYLSKIEGMIQITDAVGVFGESTEAALKQYQEVMGLVEDGVAGAKTYAAMSAEDTEKLKNVTAELVALYPELDQYVGENGVLMLEKDQVDDLIEGYKNLQLQKLMTSRVEQIGGEYADAVIDMELLKQKAKEAEDELATLTKQSDAMKNAYSGITSLFVGLGPNQAVDTTAAVDAINAYLSAFGGLSDEIMDDLNENGTNLDALFKNGLLMTPEEISQIEGGTAALSELAAIISANSYDDSKGLDEDIKAAQTALETAQKAVADYAPILKSAMADYETAKKALENFGKEGETAGTEAGEEAGQSAADELKNQESAIDTAVGELAASAQEEAKKRPVIIPARLQLTGGARGISAVAYDGSHATGLDRVPYDNYLARLHVGESVLTASEAQRWRENKSGGGVTPAQLTAAMEPVVEAVRNIRIALDIDGREFASNQAANTRNAQNRYNAQIARGYGK